MKKSKPFKRVANFIRSCIRLLMSLVVLVAAINAWIFISTDNYRISQEQLPNQPFDCILVLGARVYSDGSLSAMLEDRVSQGISLYKMGASPQILMSGDSRSQYYDEVGAMTQYALDHGVAEADILNDPLGLSTFDSVIRGLSEYGMESMIIVTQEYHLPRAVYNARQLGIDAYGVATPERGYVGQFEREVREMLARVKDFGLALGHRLFDF